MLSMSSPRLVTSSQVASSPSAARVRKRKEQRWKVSFWEAVLEWSRAHNQRIGCRVKYAETGWNRNDFLM